MLQYYRIMRANGLHALIKSSRLCQCNHERIRGLGHVPIASRKFGDTDQNFWYYNADHILNSFHNILILGPIENITKKSCQGGRKKGSIIKIPCNLVFSILQGKITYFNNLTGISHLSPHVSSLTSHVSHLMSHISCLKG